jgi:ADP-dependent NAD(P)H-hydrate dehydratase / NAD(P)H-hydrate epimerase
MGRIVIADIGIEAASDLNEIGAPAPRLPGPDDHKYSRGYVAILAGAMPGAAALAATAAAKGGAGYVRLIGPTVPGIPHAIVQGEGALEDFLSDKRIGALVIGPGLGRGDEARGLLDLALASGRALVLDADALHLLDGRSVPGAILTPHGGEFAALFPDLEGSKIDKARAAAARTGTVIVYKGADTVVAAPDGRAAIAPPAPAWLASAGNGRCPCGPRRGRTGCGARPVRGRLRRNLAPRPGGGARGARPDRR